MSDNEALNMSEEDDIDNEPMIDDNQSNNSSDSNANSDSDSSSEDSPEEATKQQHPTYQTGNQQGPNHSRITPCFMTKYERARIIGTRALQISKNAPVLIDLGKEDIDPIIIAEKELFARKIPF